MDLCDPFAKEGNDYHATLLLCEGGEGVRVVRVFVLFFYMRHFTTAYAHVLPKATETAIESANTIATCKSAGSKCKGERESLEQG
jgi:hypothetical protein